MFNATIARKVEITPELFILHIRPDAGVPDFQPGQYVALGLPAEAIRPAGFPPEREVQTPGKIIKRAYSVGSSPEQKDYFEFYIAVVPDGALTSRLVLPKEGDRIFLAPKVTGTFTLSEVPGDAHLLLLSTGTGIAPYLSMLRTSSTWQPGRKVTLVHGVRYPKDLAYREELEAYSRSHDLRYIPIVSRADDSWSGQRGHVQKLFESGFITTNTASDHVYLCGNPAMVEDMERLLVSRGFVEHSRKKPGNLHLEKYW